MNYYQVERALLFDMVEWTTGRREPPASRWPSLEKGELVTVDALRPPQVPALGLVWPRVLNAPIAPAGKPDWPVFVPQIDAAATALQTEHLLLPEDLERPAQEAPTAK
jgi:hypothetical protein